MKTYVLVSLLIVFALSETQGQRKKSVRNTLTASNYRGNIPTRKKTKYGSVHFYLTSMNYFGDLAPSPNIASTDIKLTKPSFAFGYNYKFQSRFSIEGKFRYGTIQGEDIVSAKDAFRKTRNLSFRNRIKEFSLTFIFDVNNNLGYYIHRPDWSPYIFVGIGVVLHNPQGQAPATNLEGQHLVRSGNWVDLKPLGTEGQYSTLLPTDANYGIKPYSLVQPTIPIGIGFRIRLKRRMDLRSEFTANYFFTDYLDDVSRNYVDLGVLNSDLARSMSYRTNELGTFRSPYTYIGRDGIPYKTEAGYGSEHKDNIRGKKNENDAIFSFSIGISYIVGGRVRSPRYRA